MSLLVAQRISRPQDCVLGFGIPTTAESFRESHRKGSPGCFASSFFSLARYDAEVLEPFRQIGAQIEQLGAQVVTDLTLDRYGDLFRDGRMHAVILFSHWNESSIEFCDGPSRSATIISTIPKDFAGVIDLCVCHPRDLVPGLRATHPDSAIHHIDTTATPAFWLYFYRDLFRLLRPGARNYMTAALELKDAYFRTKEARP